MCFRARALVTLARYYLSPFGQLLQQPGKERSLARVHAGRPLAGLGRELHLCPHVFETCGNLIRVPGSEAECAGAEGQLARKAVHV